MIEFTAKQKAEIEAAIVHLMRDGGRYWTAAEIARNACFEPRALRFWPHRVRVAQVDLALRRMERSGVLAVTAGMCVRALRGRREYFLKERWKPLDEMTRAELLKEIERLSDLLGYEEDGRVYAHLYDRYDTAIRLRGAA